MNYQTINFCAIIKELIHPNQGCSFIKEVDWSYMIQLAKKHNLFPMLLEGAIKHRSYISRLEYETEMQEACVIVAAQVKRTEFFLKLYQKFIEAELQPIVMKGLICRKLYGDLCDHRPSGDEDILIRPTEYWRVRDVLIANGYVPEFEIETDSQLEWIQEVSFTHPKEKLHIELHLNPMGRENKMRSQMSDLFKNVFENYMEVEQNGVLIRTMNHQDHLLYLILHAFKHFISGGFGIRQVLDILLYQEQHGAEIDLRQLCGILKNMRADHFWTDISYIGNTYLGFELPILHEPNCPRELFEDVMQCGVFGDKTQAGVTAARTTMFTVGDNMKHRRNHSFTMILEALFPRRTYLLHHSPYLEQRPWLLPIAWVKRWVRFVKKSKHNKGNLALETMKISKRRMRVLKQYDLL